MVPQNTETGKSEFGVASLLEGATVVQASAPAGHDLEAGALRIDRPVASSLAHELGHAAAGVGDNEDEQKQPGLSLPKNEPSIMNSFPFFRSLSFGGASTNCSSSSGPVTTTTTQAFCGRLLNGFSCDNSTSQSPLDYTE